MAERSLAQHVAEERNHLHHIFNLLGELGGKTSPVAHLEEETFRIREPYNDYRLDPVEQTHPGTDYRNVPLPDDLHLAFFAREIQRTQLIGHFVHEGYEIPVHYAILGAVILERQQRSFRAWHQPKLEYCVLLPEKFCPQAVLDKYRSIPGLKVVDTHGARPEYTQLRIDALRCARSETQKLRWELIQQWKQHEGSDLHEALVVDSMDIETPPSELVSNFIALSTSVYVPWSNAEVIERQLQIGAYQRGMLLKVTPVAGAQPGDAKYTWFIRLRTSAKADPEFGMLRCAIIAPDDKTALERAEQFSARVIAERLPVTFPAEGWDKLIFPVKLCRDYLESLIATKETVRSYFARD
jgi:hypothetical protein